MTQVTKSPPWVISTLAVTWGMSGAAALAELPDAQSIEYRIRQNPADENSPVVFSVELYLDPVGSNGTSIGWDITQMDFTQYVGGASVSTWRELSPAVPGNSGLWWVIHANPADPQAKEFDNPPLLRGTAEAVTVGQPDLKFFLAGGVCDSDCQQLFDGTAVALTFEFTEVGEVEPEEDGDDEPVEPRRGGDPD